MWKRKQDKLLQMLFQHLWHPRMVSVILLMLSLFVATPFARAFQLYDQGDLNIRTYNTLKYSLAWRVQDQDKDLISDLNSDDGNRNFNRGLISNRFDLLSELEATWKKNFGLRVSGAGWYDFVYNRRNDNDSPLTNNSFSASYNRFTKDTRDLMGRDAELLDAFVFGRGTFGNVGWNFRCGQHTVIWGETLFFADSGVMVGMSPLDTVKLLSVPGTKFQELLRPVPQLSWELFFANGLSLAGYYQFDWKEANVFPPAGSYFSPADVLDDGGERLLLGGGSALFRTRDQEPDNTGQWGVSVKYNADFADFGLYYRKYHSRMPQVYMYLMQGVNPFIGKIGEYSLVYHENIEVYGVSWSTLFHDVALGGDLSYRHNIDLASSAATVLPGVKADNDNHALYAIGDSMHATLNAMYMMNKSQTRELCDGATLQGEIVWQTHRVTKNRDAFMAERQNNAIGFSLGVIPSYLQVLTGTDLEVPITFRYFPRGNSGVNGFSGDESGDWSIGVTAKYRQTWLASLRYVDYFGGPSSDNPFVDRGSIYLSFEHSF